MSGSPPTALTTALACPICESRRREDYNLIGIASQPYQGGIERYEVLRCRAHGVEFADALPLPSTEVQKKRSLDGMYGTLDEAPAAPRYVDFMERVARVGLRPGVLHDVGCGNGQLLLEARRRGWTVQGNDIAQLAEDAVRARGIPFYVGSLAEIELPPSSCDVVTSYCVLPHHLTHPHHDLAAARRLLKPDGWLVAELPSDGLYRKCARLLYRLSGGRWRSVLAQIYGVGGHQFAYDPASIRQLLTKEGFGRVRVEAFHASPRWTLARFQAKPVWLRLVATTAVYALWWASRVTRQPNHMFLYAQKAGGAPE